MKAEDLLKKYREHPGVEKLAEGLKDDSPQRISLRGLTGSVRAFVNAAVFERQQLMHVFILQEKEQAAYFYNDLQRILQEYDAPAETRKVLFFPTSYKRPYEIEKTDNANVLARTEVLKRINSQARKLIIVTYPEALSEKVVHKKYLHQNTLKIETGDELSIDFVTDILLEYDFERVDFVTEPGQFSLRGGIVDVFSFGNDYPYRIEFFDEEVESIRTFNPEDQLSVTYLKKLTIIPNIQDRRLEEKRTSFISYLPNSAIIWADNFKFTTDRIEKEYTNAVEAYRKLNGEISHQSPDTLFSSKETFSKDVESHHLVETGKNYFDYTDAEIHFNTKPQPSFNKNFELLIQDLQKNASNGIENYIFAENPKQLNRLSTIFDDIQARNGEKHTAQFQPMPMAIHEGFIDEDLKHAFYTDHQIFERYHRFHLRDSFKKQDSLTLRELYDLTPGDYVTHIDHGIGIFDGLEKIDNNGRSQEAIRLIYANRDLLYVSIHSLHRIAKYTGKEGTQPKLHRLGSNNWDKLKNKTKKKVKDIARDL
ncbi:MAG: transcription-repair coupling factor, partial [Bacteroidales bacterium]|nr:transcription-repair coupling factor [Bacteroidales bacterium]